MKKARSVVEWLVRGRVPGSSAIDAARPDGGGPGYAPVFNRRQDRPGEPGRDDSSERGRRCPPGTRSTRWTRMRSGVRSRSSASSGACRERPVCDGDLERAPKAAILHPRSGVEVRSRGFPDPARQRDRQGLRGGGRSRLAHGDALRLELPEGVQPPIMLDEFAECEEAARRSPAFRAALAKRGVTDVGLVMVDAWSAGHYGNEPAEDRGKRLVRGALLGALGADGQRLRAPDRGDRRRHRLESQGGRSRRGFRRRPLAAQAGNWARLYQKQTRADLKPLQVSQPSGPSFTVSGHEVKWQNWAFRIGFNPREGLVLHTVGYNGRPILYRASIAEMIVPYADPRSRPIARTPSTSANTASA